MFASLFKHYILFVFSLYTLSLLTNQKMHKLLTFILPIALGLETIYLKQQSPEFSFFLPFLTLFIISSLVYNLSLKSCFAITLISFGINIVVYSISALLIALITLPIRNVIPFIPNLFTITASIIYPIILLCLLKNKRISNNLKLLMQFPTAYLSIFISGLALCLATIEQISSFSLTPYRFIRIGLILFTSIVLILWWRTQITKSYRERLRILETEALRAAQSEQQEYVHQLENQNERMGKIIHKDNRLVNAMADAMSQYLTSSAVLPTAELQEMGNSLAAEIIEIRSDRQALLNTKSVTPSPIPQTGHAGIDAMITYMSKEAAESKIEFQFHYGKDFFTDNATELSENDLAHLLSDALENAIIATRFGNGKKIELSMLKIKGIPTISISDSGIPFEIDTYMNLGLQRASTHLDTGGSGIGLMDLWALKEKYKATLYIDEQPETPGMTKQVVYIFDGKNRYMISTNRFKEIQQKQTRADMFIVNPNTEAVI